MKSHSTHRPSRYWIVSITVVCLALAYSVALVSAPDDPGAAGNFPATAASTSDETAQGTFVAKGCAGCHSVYDRPVGGVEASGGPDLGKRKVYGTYLELAAELWNHLPDMLQQMDRRGVAPPSFTEAEVNLLIEYLSFIRYMGEPGNYRTGRRLLERKKCTSCHDLGRDMGRPGPDLTQTTYMAPLDLATALWNHGPQMNDMFEENGVNRPKLSGHDILDLAAGVRSLSTSAAIPADAYQPGEPADGRLLYESKGCVQCHAVRGQGGDSAPDFTDLDFKKSVTEIAGDMWNHGPEMWEIMRVSGMSFPMLERSEMADLIAFLYSLGLQDAPGDEARGERLIEGKRCTNCHSIGDMGGDQASDLLEFDGHDTPATMLAAMWSHAAEMAEYSREQRIRWPSLEGREIADIFAYLQSHTTGSAGN